MTAATRAKAERAKGRDAIGKYWIFFWARVICNVSSVFVRDVSISRGLAIVGLFFTALFLIFFLRAASLAGYSLIVRLLLVVGFLVPLLGFALFFIFDGKIQTRIDTYIPAGDGLAADALPNARPASFPVRARVSVVSAPPVLSNSTTMLYHIAQGDQQGGPYNLAQLQELWRSGAISPDSHYWFEGAQDWQPITKLSKLLQS